MNVGRASDVAGIIGITGSGGGGSVSGGGTGHPRGFSRSRVGRGGRDIEEETCWIVTGEVSEGRTPLPLLACLGKVFETVPTPFSGSKKVKRLGPGNSSRAFTSRWRSSRSLKIRSWQVQYQTYQTIANVCFVHSMHSSPFHSSPFHSSPSHPSIHPSLPPSLPSSVRPSAPSIPVGACRPLPRIDRIDEVKKMRQTDAKVHVLGTQAKSHRNTCCLVRVGH